MRNAIIELLNRADERKLRLIYFYAKALIGKDSKGRNSFQDKNSECDSQ